VNFFRNFQQTVILDFSEWYYFCSFFGIFRLLADTCNASRSNRNHFMTITTTGWRRLWLQFRWIVSLKFFAIVGGCAAHPQIVAIQYLIECQSLVAVHVRLAHQMLRLFVSNRSSVGQNPRSKFRAVETAVHVGVVRVEVLAVDNQLLAVWLRCQRTKTISDFPYFIQTRKTLNWLVARAWITARARTP